MAATHEQGGMKTSAQADSGGGTDAIPVLLRGIDLRCDFDTRDFHGRRTKLAALCGVDLCVRRGEVLGVLGESGCGKTTLARCLVRLIEQLG